MAIQDLDLSRYKLGWSDAEDYVFKPKKGLSEDIVREMSEMKGEPEWMRKFRLNALRRFEPQADGGVVRRQHARPRLRRHLLLLEAHRGAGRRLGGPPRRDQVHLREARASPRQSASTSPASPPSTSPRSSSTATARTSRPRASCSATWTPRSSEYPEIVRQWFGTIIPPNDNKFAALNSAVWSGGSLHLRAPGRQRRAAPPGLLPDQHREHGPVRADADHRGRGLPGALRRGLLGARCTRRDSLHSAVVELVALPGSRITYTTIQNWSNERLQPRDQACARRGRGARRVDRRQHRIAAHDEVPERRTWSARRRPARSSRSPTPDPASTRTRAPR